MIFNNNGIPTVNDKTNFESSDSLVRAYQLPKEYSELYEWMRKIFLSQ